MDKNKFQTNASLAKNGMNLKNAFVAFVLVTLSFLTFERWQTDISNVFGIALFAAALSIEAYRRFMCRTTHGFDELLYITPRRFFLDLLLISIFLMLGGLFVAWVPADCFYIGYAAFWIVGYLILITRAGCLVSIFLTVVIGWLSFMFAAVIGFPNPIIEKGYPIMDQEIREQDDRLRDKKPGFDTSLFEKRAGSYRDSYIMVNKSDAVVGLDIADATKNENKLAKKIYPTFSAACKAAESFDCTLLPSVDMLDAYSKYLDDRLFAALELHLNECSSIYPGGKQGFLKELLNQVVKLPKDKARDDAAGVLAAAVELGGEKLNLDPEIAGIARSKTDNFLDNKSASTPIGFYTKSKALALVFQRDRFLQQKMDIISAARITEVYAKSPRLLAAYHKFREVAEKTCNPDANLNLEDLLPYRAHFGDPSSLETALEGSPAWERNRKRGNVNPITSGVAFWPFSTSRHARLFAKLYRDTELPETEVMSDLILAIKSGRMDLKPEADSGYFDYQTYSLETMLMPNRAIEANKLLLHAAYKRRLVDSFEAMLTKRVETHIKQLFELQTAGRHSKPFVAYPELTLEPNSTVYLRDARAYRFLRGELGKIFDEADLAAVKIDGLNSNLLKQLDDAVVLYYGCYLMCCEDLVFDPKLNKNELSMLPSMGNLPGNLKSDLLITRIKGPSVAEKKAWSAAVGKASAWLKGIDQQAFCKEDTRVIVPVMSNANGTQHRNWAVIGVKLVKVKSYYAREPYALQDRHYEDADDREFMLKRGVRNGAHVTWQTKEYTIPVQEFAEVNMGPKPLTRDEFRSICDRYGSKAEIVEALQGKTSRTVSPAPYLAGILLVFGGTAFYMWFRMRKRHIV